MAKTYDVASGPSVAGDDPVNESDPSGQFRCVPGEPLTWAGCAGDAAEDIAGEGEAVAGGAIGALAPAVAIGAAIGGATAIVWSALQAKPAGGTAEIPIWFGQTSVSPTFGNQEQTPIDSAPNGTPIHIFPWISHGSPVAVAINNRTLANYSLAYVTYPPVVWATPTAAQKASVRDHPGLPSPVVQVRKGGQVCDLPGTTSGLIWSTAFAQLDA